MSVRGRGGLRGVRPGKTSLGAPLKGEIRRTVRELTAGRSMSLRGPMSADAGLEVGTITPDGDLVIYEEPTTPSVSVTGAALAAATGLIAVAVSASQIDLAWTDNATAEDGYSVERAASPLGPWSEIGTPAADAESYSDTGLVSGTDYYYRVRPYRGATYGDYSNTAGASTWS